MQFQFDRSALLEIEYVGDITVVHFTDSKILEEQNVQTVAEQLFSLVNKGRKKILLNLFNIDHLSAIFIGKLIFLNRWLKNNGGMLVFCNIGPEMENLFLITRLNVLFNIVGEEQEAFLAFEKSIAS